MTAARLSNKISFEILGEPSGSMPPDDEEPNEGEQEQKQSDGGAATGGVGDGAVGGVSEDYATQSAADDDPSLPALLKIFSPPTRGRPRCQPMALYA